MGSSRRRRRKKKPSIARADYMFWLTPLFIIVPLGILMWLGFTEWMPKLKEALEAVARLVVLS